jgi:uncharacterized protein
MIRYSHAMTCLMTYYDKKRTESISIMLQANLKIQTQLTYPAIGKGPFPGVLLVHGSGPTDKNETLLDVKPFWQIAQYLSERGFAVLRYDKRGVGPNFSILNTNVWGNATVNDFINDAEKALNVLLQQPEVDSKRISIIGHSEGTVIAPRVAIDNSTKVKNIILVGVVAQNTLGIFHNQGVDLPLEYATHVLDKNHTGLISSQVSQAAPLFHSDKQFERCE